MESKGIESTSDDDQTDFVQTVFNLLNNYVGMILLTQPFCFALAGWSSAGLLALLSVFGCHCGILLVECTAKVAAVQGTNILPSYAEVGEHRMGGSGKWCILIASWCEYFFAAVSMCIVGWKNAIVLLPNWDSNSLFFWCIALSSPSLVVKNFRMISYISYFGFACITFVCAILFQFAFSMDVSGSDSSRTLIRWEGLALASSQILAGITGHVGLPPMYSAMADKSKFTSALRTNFAVWYTLHLAVGACGYYLYGMDASIIVTTNMFESVRAFSAAGNLFSVTAVTIGITLKQLVTIPLLVQVLVLILLPSGSDIRSPQNTILQCSVFFLVFGFAYKLHGLLPYVNAIVGVNSIFISMVVPIVCHHMLEKHTSQVANLVFFTQLVVATVLMLIIAYIECVSRLPIRAHPFRRQSRPAARPSRFTLHTAHGVRIPACSVINYSQNLA